MFVWDIYANAVSSHLYCKYSIFTYLNSCSANQKEEITNGLPDKIYVQFQMTIIMIL